MKSINLAPHVDSGEKNDFNLMTKDFEIKKGQKKKMVAFWQVGYQKIVKSGQMIDYHII